MPLVKCHECDNEISTEAKVCPQCGAKNKSKPKTSRWLIAIAVFIFIYGWYKYSEFEYGHLFDGPNCENPSSFKRTFEGSPYAQQEKLRVIEVSEMKEVSTGPLPEDIVCEVTFRLNDSNKVTYTFTFESKEGGGYFIKGTPK